MRPFRELRVWEASHALTLDVYKATGRFPRDEAYGLTSQMRRSCWSIPMNIVEGSARGDAEFHQFLRIALGSATELEYQLLLAYDLGYMQPADYDSLDGKLGSVKRMLVSFMKTLKSAPSTGEGGGIHARGRRPTANSQRPIANGQELSAGHVQ